VDLDEVAGRLYALPPSEFTAARTAEAAAAKQAGDAALARRIAGLRRPTVSAWVVNRFAREHSDELDELLSVGRELRAAWRTRDAEALAELTRRRGEVTGRLARLIRQGGDVSAAAAAEADRTLDAAVVDAGAAEEVRRGRLVKPLNYSGFAPAPAAGGRKQSMADEEARARKREETRARERREAEAAHREWRAALAGAEREHGERAEEAAKLEAELATARKRLAESAQRLEVTRREERHARRRLEELEE
jgi:hypothetical protein